MLLNEKQIQERIEKNKQLLTIPQKIQEGSLPANSEDMIVRHMYYEIEMKVDPVTGLIEPLYKVHQSDGGREVARIDTPVFSTRAVVVKLSQKAEEAGYKVGDIVWLPIHVAESPAYEFFIERESPVIMPDGFKRVPYRLIEFIEKDPYTNG